MSEIRVLLIGFGAVHQHLCSILATKPHLRFGGRRILIVGACDSQGAVYCHAGLSPGALLAHKRGGNSVSSFGRNSSSIPNEPQAEDEYLRFANAQILAEQCPAYDVLLEASPVNLTTGEPGYSCTRAALSRTPPAHVIFANKAPLVLFYEELVSLASSAHRQIRHSATVCGGLPVLNVATRDLFGAEVTKVEGIFNSTTSYILGEMRKGEDTKTALAEAQRRGIAEADPSLDIDGYDTANKLVLIANVLGLRARVGDRVRLSDVAITGIRDVTTQDIENASRNDQRIQLVAAAVRTSTADSPASPSHPLYTFSVCPQPLDRQSFLGGFSGCDMGVAFHTDIYETIFMKTNEEGVYPTAAAMLRDLNLLYA